MFHSCFHLCFWFLVFGFPFRVVFVSCYPFPEIWDEVPENFEKTEFFDRGLSVSHGTSVLAATPASQNGVAGLWT